MLVFLSFRIYRIVPVNNAAAGNKSKTEDTLNSNGILTEEGDESSQFSQPKSVTNVSSQMQINSKSGSATADVSSAAKRTSLVSTERSERLGKRVFGLVVNFAFPFTEFGFQYGYVVERVVV